MKAVLARVLRWRQLERTRPAAATPQCRPWAWSASSPVRSRGLCESDRRHRRHRCRRRHRRLPAMPPWDERGVAATWHCAAQLAPLPGIAARRAVCSAPACDAVAPPPAVPLAPPLCLAPAGPVLSLTYDGSPAWAVLVPAAAAALLRSPAGDGSPATAAPPLQRAPALYRGPRQLSCTYAFEWRCGGGIYRVRRSLRMSLAVAALIADASPRSEQAADVADTGGVLESKARAPHTPASALALRVAPVLTHLRR
jgi:hypothetical protein